MQRRNFLFVSTLALALFGSVRSGPLHKRFAGDGTFYNAGLGACGDTNSNSELVCAMNAPQYDGSCNRVVRITGPKGSVTCTIKDKCPECAFGSIDMSPSAFNQIADPSQGRVQITWDFVDAPGPAPAPTPAPKPEPEPKTPPPPPPPTPTDIPPILPQSDVQQDPDNGDDDADATIHSVSYAFISGDFLLINGGELAAGGNPLDDPEAYYDEIINNVTDDSDIDQTDDATNQTETDDDETTTTKPNATQYY